MKYNTGAQVKQDDKVCVQSFVCISVSAYVDLGEQKEFLSSGTLTSRQQVYISLNHGVGLQNRYVQLQAPVTISQVKCWLESFRCNTLNIKHYRVKIITAS